MAIQVNIIVLAALAAYAILLTTLFTIACAARGKLENDLIMITKTHRDQLEHFIHMCKITQEELDQLKKQQEDK